MMKMKMISRLRRRTFRVQPPKKCLLCYGMYLSSLSLSLSLFVFSRRTQKSSKSFLSLFASKSLLKSYYGFVFFFFFFFQNTQLLIEREREREREHNTQKIKPTLNPINTHTEKKRETFERGFYCVEGGFWKKQNRLVVNGSQKPSSF